MKLCEQCGKPINERTDRNVRFCSRACFGKSCRKHPVYRLCPHCNRQYVVSKKHSSQKYCSTDCRDAARTTLVNLSCDQCGKSIQEKPSRIARLKHHFCSWQCYTAWTQENAPSGQNHWQYNRVAVRCEICGKEFTRCPSHIRDHIFCSARCRESWQCSSGYSSGSNSGTWKGGYEPYYGPNWRQQRRNARRHSGYVCHRCGASESELGKQLDVHHIKAFREFGIERYREANSLKNLICYCASCHQIIEHQESLAESTNEEPSRALVMSNPL